MTRGRKSEGARLVEQLDGSDEAKARLAAFLEALAGRRTAAEAALGLGVSERRFRTLRTHLLQAALRSLEARPLGRPAQRSEEADGQLAALEKQLRDVRLDLRAAQIREEIALAMPHLLRGGRPRRRARKTPRRAGKGAASNGSGPSHGTDNTDPTSEGLPGNVRRGPWSGRSALTRSPLPEGRHGWVCRRERSPPGWACRPGLWRAGKCNGGKRGSAIAPAVARHNGRTERYVGGHWPCSASSGLGRAWRRCRRSARGWHGGRCKTCSAVTAGRGAVGGGC
jgi:hypothetical protein